jgi:hypothetical protein
MIATIWTTDLETGLHFLNESPPVSAQGDHVDVELTLGRMVIVEKHIPLHREHPNLILEEIATHHYCRVALKSETARVGREWTEHGGHLRRCGPC